MLPTQVFVRYLTQLQLILEKLASSELDEGEVLSASLTEDMFPLAQQAATAIDFSLRICCPLAGESTISFVNNEASPSFSVLAEHLRQTKRYLENLPPELFRGWQTRQIETTAGFAQLSLSGEEFFHQYGLANFLFHLNMVYAIGRKLGVSLSKQDYDGYHQYPQNFRF